ncbi:MAG: DUF4321 domain-containing protein [bacterium]|nr:DUF4321 domain-containing protein [bacterium]MCX7916870.1 DUF4321 domain-containing protein [bacterium]MDW8163147.1 DUF4321 domain-containing protein [Candidatus Omnitrophota bacterium]
MKFVYIILIIFLSALIGTVIGEFIIYFTPTSFPYHQFLTFRLTPFFEVHQIDLIVFNLSFSFKFNFNFFTLIGLVIGSIFSLRKV